MSIDLDTIRQSIYTGIRWGERLTDAESAEALSALDRIIAEVERLTQALEVTEKERDQWIESAMSRRQALNDVDAIHTAVHLALSPEGGVNGWRPSRGVDSLIDLALDVRESRDAERSRSAAIQIEAERHRRIADEAVARIESAEDERAAVVAWLRRMEINAIHWSGRQDDDRADIYHRLIDVFECGEHIREEE